MTTTTPKRTLWNALFLAGLLACYFVAGGVEADEEYPADDTSRLAPDPVSKPLNPYDFGDDD